MCPPDNWENGVTYSYPIEISNDGERITDTSLASHTPHNDEQNVSTKFHNYDYMNASHDIALPLDLTPSPRYGSIGFNHWGGIHADTWSTSSDSGNKWQENAIGSTRADSDGHGMDGETMNHYFRATNPMLFPIDAPAGVYNIPNSSLMDFNPKQPCGPTDQVPNSCITDNFNIREASVNISMPVAAPMPQTAATQAVPTPVPATAPTRRVIRCSIPWCPITFKRKHEQVRHESSVHGINQGIHRCQVVGCPTQGRGFSRKDKLTEHMWKKHGNLGYAKRAL
jgi:uncharacterized C2H2 Zn-finger protein